MKTKASNSYLQPSLSGGLGMWKAEVTLQCNFLRWSLCFVSRDCILNYVYVSVGLRT